MSTDPIEAVTILENLASFFAERYPDWRGIYKARGEVRRLETLRSEELLTFYLASRLGLDSGDPSARRLLGTIILAAMPESSQGLRVEEAASAEAATHWIDAEALRAGIEKSFPKIAAKQKNAAVANAANRFEPELRRPFLKRIDQAATLSAAVEICGEWIEEWPFEERCRFLSTAKKACFVPTRGVARTLQRIGWLALPPSGAARQAQTQLRHRLLALAERLGRQTGREPGQVGLIFEFLSGDHSICARSSGDILCAEPPKCSDCLVAPNCQFALMHDLADDIAGEKARTDLNNLREGLARKLRSIHQRILDGGGAALGDDEVLAAVIGKGSGAQSPLEVAQRLLESFGGLGNIDGAEADAIVRESGLTRRTVAELKASLELGRRLGKARLTRETKISDPEHVYDLLFPRLGALKQERFMMLMLDSKHQVIGIREVSRGTLNSSLVHPREVFRPAIEAAAHAVIFAHNHPSGEPTPSGADRETTHRLQEAGRLLEIKVLDHVIIGRGRYYSFTEDEESVVES